MFSKYVVVICVLILHFNKSDATDVYGPQMIKFTTNVNVTVSYIILKNIPSNSKKAELLFHDHKYVSAFAYKNATISGSEAVFTNIFLALSSFQSDKEIISRIILNNDEIYGEKKVMEFKYQFAEAPHVCLKSCRIIINYNDRDVNDTVIHNTTFKETNTTINGLEGERGKYQVFVCIFIVSAALIVISIIIINYLIIILLGWILQHCDRSDTTSHMKSCQSVDYINLCKQKEPKNTTDKQCLDQECDSSTLYSTPTPKSLRNTSQSDYDYSYANCGSGVGFVNLKK